MRVLCVCPRFAPVNAADSHRLRLLLPYFAALGWEAEVLAVEPASIPAPTDPWLAARMPRNIPVHRVRAWQSNHWGFNGLTQRAFAGLYRKGSELLRAKHFDLIFFSTTDFLVHALGPLWKRKFKVPYCMDFQDPWVNDYYKLHPEVMPPGGRLKFRLADSVHRLAERWVVRHSSGFLAVSAAYLTMLDTRYGTAVANPPRCVAEFPAEPDESRGETPTKVTPGSPRVWRYVGRGGADMALAARAFFRAWKRAIDLGLLSPDAVRMEVIGTSYDPSPSAAKTIQPHAEQEGIAKQVFEQTRRVGYSEMLNLLATSDGLIVFGSDDPAYTASKIYPYMLSGKPLLAIFHRESSVTHLLERAGGGACVNFNANVNHDSLSDDILRTWFDQGACPAARPLDRNAFEPFTARSQAVRITQWFLETARYPR